MRKAWILWQGPGDRIRTCVEIPEAWLADYRKRVVEEWHGVVFGVYRLRKGPPERMIAY